MPKEYFSVLGIWGFAVLHWTFSHSTMLKLAEGGGKCPEASTYPRVPRTAPAPPGSTTLWLQATDYFPKIKDTQPFVEFLVISFPRG